MKEKYLKIKNLSISENLANFINKELLPGTKINKEQFWKGFDKCVHELAPKNIKLLQKRERLQKAIDALHIDKKDDQLNLKKYIHAYSTHIYKYMISYGSSSSKSSSGLMITRRFFRGKFNAFFFLLLVLSSSSASVPSSSYKSDVCIRL